MSERSEEHGHAVANVSFRPRRLQGADSTQASSLVDTCLFVALVVKAAESSARWRPLRCKHSSAHRDSRRGAEPRFGAVADSQADRRGGAGGGSVCGILPGTDVRKERLGAHRNRRR
jgi:hypothetical protein